MDDIELSDIILESVYGAKLLSIEKKEALMKGGNDKLRQMLDEEREQYFKKNWLVRFLRYGGIMSMPFIQRTVEMLKNTYKKFAYGKETEEYLKLPDSILTETSRAENYIYNLEKFYENPEHNKGCLDKMLVLLEGAYDTKFEIAYSKNIREEKGKKKLRNYSGLGFVLTALINSYHPNVPMATLAIGLGIFAFMSHVKTKDVTSQLKNDKKEHLEVLKIKKLIERTEPSDLERVLIENKSSISQYL